MYLRGTSCFVVCGADVDECAERLHSCDAQAETCRNTEGYYECDEKCDQGFAFSPVFRTCMGEAGRGKDNISF